MDERRVNAFASEFDPQPFHRDGELAKSTLFGGLAASGWHTAALTMRLLVDGGLPIAEWPRPTRPGDVLHVDSEFVEIIASHTHPGHGTVFARGETRNQRGEFVQITTVRLIAAARPKRARTYISFNSYLSNIR